MWFERNGLENVVGMGKGGTVNVAGLRVTMTSAVHSSSFDSGPEPHYAGEPAGYVLTLENGAAIYFAGDTGPTMDMQIIGDLYQPEIAVLPIGDHYTMGPREAAYAARLVRARWVIPCHYGTFPVLTGTPDALRVELEKLGVGAVVVAPKPGETIR
jgi:L-ascorbate metabolism protein UlaG (beta-lactamase superfamily)